MKKIKNLTEFEKILKIIEKLNDKYCYEHFKSIREFNPCDNNISLGKMLASTEIRETLISEFLKEVKSNV